MGAKRPEQTEVGWETRVLATLHNKWAATPDLAPRTPEEVEAAVQLALQFRLDTFPAGAVRRTHTSDLANVSR